MAEVKFFLVEFRVVAILCSSMTAETIIPTILPLQAPVTSCFLRTVSDKEKSGTLVYQGFPTYPGKRGIFSDGVGLHRTKENREPLNTKCSRHTRAYPDLKNGGAEATERWLYLSVIAKFISPEGFFYPQVYPWWMLQEKSCPTPSVLDRRRPKQREVLYKQRRAPSILSKAQTFF